MQIQQARVGRAPQVPVPSVSATPLEISRELRQQLRVTRHRAFERHQENAQWTEELLEGCEAQDVAFVTPSGLAASPEELQKQIEATEQVAGELERQKEDGQKEHCRFEEMLATLQTAGDAATLTECEAKLEAEKKRLLPKKPRKMEIVRL
ncbi:hypothetical protein PHYPSEUDO_009019 [Phytophthora pseudosyringae]|uniref:Uncharacterized protein n=1 Tax=Phytophthora pseudosyringae TaxID=221518 RepID=A0A8T1VDJ1_9STRA|nr:hypothetical protein PHYPSEUDO_009019 [Phytophthora pseudosyringae]